MKYGIVFVFICLTLVILSFFVKGALGQPIYYQKEADKVLEGPFEAPNSDSRYALTIAIVENHSFLFTKDLAKFSLPDLVTYKGKYFSIFTPGISFIGVPFYIFGKQFGLQQLFTYFSVTIFAFMNTLLIAKISNKLGANLYASLLAGFIFLFGTNELSYAISYTQHATSVTFLLLSLLLIFGKRSIVKNILFGIFIGISLLLDIPNIIFLLPIGVYFLFQYLSIKKINKLIKIKFDTKILLILLGIIPFVGVMAWYNLNTSGSYTLLAQFLGQTLSLNPKTQQQSQQQNEHASNERVLPFLSESQINGMYTLLVSNERSLLVYSPVTLLGIFGIIVLYEKKKQKFIASIISSIVLLNIILYSMFSDPWGGWAFGPRYLIPAEAMLCIGIAIAVQVYSKRFWFALIFAITVSYSIFINIVGALTTSLVPTKHDALKATPHLFYNYLYNIHLINENKLGSLLYNILFFNINPWIFVSFIVAITILVALSLYLVVYKSQNKSTI